MRDLSGLGTGGKRETKYWSVKVVKDGYAGGVPERRSTSSHKTRGSSLIIWEKETKTFGSLSRLVCLVNYIKKKRLSRGIVPTERVYELGKF